MKTQRMMSGSPLPFLALLWISCLLFPTGSSVEISPLIGVPLHRLHHYDLTKETFECLDRSGSIPVGSVNDDYCDCKDGSDEPSTSACGMIPGSKFYCPDGIHLGNTTIPASAVNDGVADCCDGADEWKSSARELLRNRCVETKLLELQRIARHNEMVTKAMVVKAQKVSEYKNGFAEIEKKKAKLPQLMKQAEVNADQARRKNDQKGFDKFNREIQSITFRAAYLKQLQKEHFGREMEYFHLWDQCFQIVSNERDFRGGCAEPIAHDFVFDFCPFQGVFQRKLEKGKPVEGSKTILGLWKGYTLGADRILMNYGGGDTCWNGPDRRVLVELRCGFLSKVVRVRENGKCQYEIDFETPSACRMRDFQSNPALSGQVGLAESSPGTSWFDISSWVGAWF